MAVKYLDTRGPDNSLCTMPVITDAKIAISSDMSKAIRNRVDKTKKQGVPVTRWSIATKSSHVAIERLSDRYEPSYTKIF